MTLRPRFTVRVVLLCLVSGPLLSLLFIQSIPQGNTLWGESLNVGHSALFGVIAIMALWTGKAHGKFVRLKLWRQYVGVGLAVLLLGVVTEFVQPYFHRDCEVGDMARDAVGILASLATLALFNHLISDDRVRVSKRTRIILIAVTIGCVIGVTIPADGVALAYLHRDRSFPVLASYESWFSRRFIYFQNARLEPTAPPAGWGEERPELCARITFYPSWYPGIRIDEVVPDWRGYDSLVFDLYSELKSTMFLGLRIDDREHDNNYSDRFNSELKVVPGLTHVAVSLAAIKHAPRKREFDLTAVAKLYLFAGNPKDTFAIYLGPIRLKH